jgi:hypothetical protein
LQHLSIEHYYAVRLFLVKFKLSSGIIGRTPQNLGIGEMKLWLIRLHIVLAA